MSSITKLIGAVIAAMLIATLVTVAIMIATHADAAGVDANRSYAASVTGFAARSGGGHGKH